MSTVSDPPSGAPRVHRHLYFVACERVLKSVVRLVDARGLAMSVEVDLGRAPSQAIIDTHHIQLTYGCSTRTIEVDHDTFMNAEFFKMLVLHQVQTVIAELALEPGYKLCRLVLSLLGNVGARPVVELGHLTRLFGN